MTKQITPYFCHSASGTICPGLTTRRTRGCSYLQRQPLSTVPRSAAQKSAAAFLQGLAQAWTHYRAIAEPTWRVTPDFSNHDAYHNYIAGNMARRAIGLWPTLLYPPNPASPPKELNSANRLPTERGLQIILNDADTVVGYFIAARLRIGAPTTMTPKTATYLNFTYLYDARRHLLHCPIGGTYSVDAVRTNAYGVASAQWTRDANVIPD